MRFVSKIISKVAAFVLPAIFLSPAALATTVNVPLNGNINGAIQQVSSAGGGTVMLASGTWTISGPIKMLSNVTLEGAGNPNTTLVANGDFNMIEETADGESNMTVENLKISGDPYSSSSNGIYIDSLGTYNSNITISNVQVLNCGGQGCQLKRCNGFSIRNCNFHNNGISDLYHNCYCFDVNNGSITNCQCVDSPMGSGIHLNTDSNGGTCNNVIISGCNCSGNGQDGMDLMGSLSKVTVSSNTCNNNVNADDDGGYGIRIWSGSGSCTDNTVDGNAVGGYLIWSGWTVSGNT